MPLHKQFFLFVLLVAVSPFSIAKIFYSKNEAMALAFGDGAHVENLALFPDDLQVAAIQKEAKVKLESGMFTLYVGKQQGKILGYAAIETMNVRTKTGNLDGRPVSRRRSAPSCYPCLP